jgi:hypothetical protein
MNRSGARREDGAFGSIFHGPVHGSPEHTPMFTLSKTGPQVNSRFSNGELAVRNGQHRQRNGFESVTYIVGQARTEEVKLNMSLYSV